MSALEGTSVNKGSGERTAPLGHYIFSILTDNTQSVLADVCCSMTLCAFFHIQNLDR